MDESMILQIRKLSKGWDRLTDIVLNAEDIKGSVLRELLKDSYKTARALSTTEFVHKELCRLMLNMREFLYFASLMEDKEVGLDFYCYVQLNWVITAIENGVLDGEYEYKFPRKEKSNCPTDFFVLDFENDPDCLKKLIVGKIDKQYAGIKLSGFDTVCVEIN